MTRRDSSLSRRALRLRCGAIAALALTVACAAGADWPQFRGAGSNAVAPDQNLPTSWSPSENIAWKAALPGRGPSSPIVVAGRVIVTASSGFKQDRLHVLAFDLASGKQLWERQFWATGRTLTHPTSANAAPTPASDGKRIFAFFSSNDLVCLDLDGNLQWLRGLGYDYPSAGNDVGMSSSPTVVGGTVIVQVENQGDSFAAGIDTATGQTKWRVDRDRSPTWCSPIAIRGSEGDSVLLQSPAGLTAVDAHTGKERWAFRSACDAISSVTAAEGVVFVPSSGTTALRPSSSQSEPEVVWQAADVKPGAASVIVHDGRLVAINQSGVLVVAVAASGKVAFRVRLEGAYWSSPVLAGNRVYCFADNGNATVVQISSDGNKGEIVGRGTLGEKIQGSPAVADGALIVRSDSHLWKIGGK